ncbi:MAG: DUF4398 domain-containing protein [Candidatus Wenzhouxiangella sp. M2_3B_020]
MPNRPFLPGPALACVMAATVVLAGCATTDADPEILLEADDAIALAQRAGASDHAPLELDEAMELRSEAAQAVSEDEPVEASRLVQRAALQARLAIVRAEGARARAELERKRAELEALRDELRDAFGDAIDTTPDREDAE